MNDPNFEQNRIEYKANKASADKGLKNGRPNTKKAEKGECSNILLGPTSHLFLPVAASSTTAPAASEGSSKDTKKAAEPATALTDFFSAIENGQTTVFNPQTG